MSVLAIRMNDYQIQLVFEGFSPDIVHYYEQLYAPYMIKAHTDRGNCQIELNKDGEGFHIAYQDIQRKDDMTNMSGSLHVAIAEILSDLCKKDRVALLHASAIRFQNSNVVMIGPKSSGKTTALLYYLQQGGIYLGDEAVIVSADGILPLAMPLRVKPTTEEYLMRKYKMRLKFIPCPQAIAHRKQCLSFDGILWEKSAWIMADAVFYFDQDVTGCQQISAKQAFAHLLKNMRNAADLNCVKDLTNLAQCPAYEIGMKNRFQEMTAVMQIAGNK